MFGQESSNGIDCGTVVTVPTFTGALDQSWYDDTNDYRANGITQIFGQTNQYPLEGHLRTKFDEYTWFGIEIPENKSQGIEHYNLFSIRRIRAVRPWGRWRLQSGIGNGSKWLYGNRKRSGIDHLHRVIIIRNPIFQGFQSTNGLRLEICFCSF